MLQESSPRLPALCRRGKRGTARMPYLRTERLVVWNELSPFSSYKSTFDGIACIRKSCPRHTGSIDVLSRHMIIDPKSCTALLAGREQIQRKSLNGKSSNYWVIATSPWMIRNRLSDQLLPVIAVCRLKSFLPSLRTSNQARGKRKLQSQSPKNPTMDS